MYLSVSHTVIVGSLGLTVVVVVGNAVPVLLSLSLDCSLLTGSNHWQIALRSPISQNFIAYKKDLPGFSSILTWNACPGQFLQFFDINLIGFQDFFKTLQFGLIHRIVVFVI